MILIIISHSDEDNQRIEKCLDYYHDQHYPFVHNKIPPTAGVTVISRSNRRIVTEDRTTISYFVSAVNYNFRVTWHRKWYHGISDRIRAFWAIFICFKFKVTWHENESEIEKSGPIKFRYCPLMSKTAVGSRIPSTMAEEIDIQNGTFRSFQSLVTLTLTFFKGQGHTVGHHSSIFTHTPSFMKIGQQ